MSPTYDVSICAFKDHPVAVDLNSFFTVKFFSGTEAEMNRLSNFNFFQHKQF